MALPRPPVALLTLLLAGCPPLEPPPTQPSPGPPARVPTDVTFFAFGDPQYGGGAADKNTWHIAAMNAFPGTPWPDDTPWAGEPVADPRGVLIAGDLTQNGQDGRSALDSDELGFFEADYGLDGTDGDLRFPVYEGYGNHDLDPAAAGFGGPFDWRSYYDGSTPSADAVADRNDDRVALTEVAEQRAGHYSWDWDWLHLVNCDVFPGDEPSPVTQDSLTRDPRDALAFLEDDLATHVADTGRPVVVMGHYGFDGFGQEERWWTDEQKDLFRAAITPYDVVLYVHGHTHATSTYEVQGLRMVNAGSPYYTEYNADGRGHFTVIRITDEVIVARDVAWEPGTGDASFAGWSLHLDR